MITSVTKEVTFDCAHMLSGHKSKCANLHGHTYKVQVTVRGFLQTNADSSKGMVLDFGDLKEIINKVIVEPFDHALIFSAKAFRNEAEKELLAWAKRHYMRFYVMEGRTTSEHMAAEMRIAIRQALDAKDIRYEHVGIKVWETPTSFAEV